MFVDYQTKTKLVENIGINLTKINENVFILRIVGYVKEELKHYLNLEESAPLIVAQIPSNLFEINSVYSANVLFEKRGKLKEARSWILNSELRNFLIIRSAPDEWYEVKIFEKGTIAFIDENLPVAKYEYIVTKPNPYEKLKTIEKELVVSLYNFVKL